MQIVSKGGNLHKIANTIFGENKKYFKMSSAETFTQNTRVNVHVF